MSRTVAAAPAAPPAKTAPSPRSRAARLRIDEEHRQLGELLRALTHTHDLARTAALLDELQALLVRHFAGEEGDDGLHQVVGEGASHRLTNLHQLFEEHRQLLARLEAVRAEAAAALAGPVRRVNEGITWLAETLRRHEKQEEALFGEAFYTDLGRS
jgi:hemerythrin